VLIGMDVLRRMGVDGVLRRNVRSLCRVVGVVVWIGIVRLRVRRVKGRVKGVERGEWKRRRIFLCFFM